MKSRAPRNRTISLSNQEEVDFHGRLLTLAKQASVGELQGRTILQDTLCVIPLLPAGFVDLLFLDPPYNLSKQFNSRTFRELTDEGYESWLESWLPGLLHTLKPTASVYICGDWRSSSSLSRVMSRYFHLRNRITWEREKGRGANGNWKNCSEDIWFATVSNDYYFNPEAVKLKRKVLAPYRDHNGQPKDWTEERGGHFRSTFPSNLWTDMTVPFWSMPENTDHPTQKPEKLMAKIILASSREGDFVFDPFLGSGTTSVVAKKLGRNFSGIEIDPLFACLAEKRLSLAEQDRAVQGYRDGFFWERNSSNAQSIAGSKRKLVGESEISPRLL